MKLENRLRIDFARQTKDSKPFFIPQELLEVLRRSGDIPKVHGAGPSSGLFENVEAPCGCRGTFSLGEYVDGFEVKFGWWEAVTHRLTCPGVGRVP